MGEDGVIFEVKDFHEMGTALLGSRISTDVDVCAGKPIVAIDTFVSAQPLVGGRSDFEIHVRRESSAKGHRHA